MIKKLTVTAILFLLPAYIGYCAEGTIMPDTNQAVSKIKIIDRFIGIDNVCAFPNLTLLGDGTIIATIFNQPSHGLREGDVECWASTDGGRTWQYRGTPARHERGTNRMNVAAGLSNNGDLIVFAAGWGYAPDFRSKPLAILVSRSGDGGYTWKVTESALAVPEGFASVGPYGDIVICSDNKLAVPLCCVKGKDKWEDAKVPFDKVYIVGSDTAYILFSNDDGQTWGPESLVLSEACNETSILRLEGGRWLAASRTADNLARLRYFVSEDDAKTWVEKAPLTGSDQHPPHFLHLSDGRIILTYGDRNGSTRGIRIRISSDKGQTWGPEQELVSLKSPDNTYDCGYPSAVQLSDGTIVTAYYADKIDSHQRYHMGVVRWRLSGKLSVVAAGAKVEKLAGGFKFTEGPASDAEGNIFFTDIPNNRIHKWSLEGKLSTFRESSGGANGLFFDKAGNLLACEGNNKRLVSIDPNGKVNVLADKYNGKPFNKPNDLWVDPKGGVYFSDPAYGANVVQDGEHVYYLTADRKNVIRVIDDMVRPNGVIGTADGKLLYVADRGANKTYVYTVNDDGTLSNKKLFAPEGADGMTIDNEGNIYVTTKGISVYNMSGEKIETIEVPEQPSNVCFGGKDKQTLFITARTSFYSVGMRVKGL